MFTRKTVPLVLSVLLAAIPVAASPWEADWTIDEEMGALEGPAWQPIILPYGDGKRRGAPDWTIYRQQPPGAQGDFRNVRPDAVAGIPRGNPSGAGDIPGSQFTGAGSGAGGGAATGGAGGTGAVADGGQQGGSGQNPNGPVIDPPDPGNADIPTDPLPLPPFDSPF